MSCAQELQFGQSGWQNCIDSIWRSMDLRRTSSDFKCCRNTHMTFSPPWRPGHTQETKLKHKIHSGEQKDRQLWRIQYIQETSSCEDQQGLNYRMLLWGVANGCLQCLQYIYVECCVSLRWSNVHLAFAVTSQWKKQHQRQESWPYQH